MIGAVGMLRLAARVVMAMVVMPMLAVRVLVAVVPLTVMDILRSVRVYRGCCGSRPTRIAS